MSKLLLQGWFKRSRDPVEPSDQETTFHWVKNPRIWFYFSAFLLFSIVIHGTGFYLFQVVYPPPLRIEPTTDSINILNRSDASARSVLKRLEDRTIFLRPPSLDSDTRVKIEEVAVRFTPSFQNTSVSPIPPDFGWSLPPQISPAETSFAASEETKSNLEVSFEGTIASRRLAPWSILDDYLSRAASLPPIRVQLEADEKGLVKVEEVSGEISEEDQQGLTEVIESTLRFLPSDDNANGSMRIAFE
ncbi:MAG: hypothetical protein AAF357_13490 [Verrucomicrobiota bacterium]